MTTILNALKAILHFFKHSYLDVLFPCMFVAFLGILIGFISHKKTFFLGAIPLATFQLNTRPRKSLGWKCPAELFLPVGEFDFKDRKSVV